MYTNKEYESFERIGVEKHRSYYIPFAETDKVKNTFGIVDRRSSSRFLSLDGMWQIRQHDNISQVEIDEELSCEIPVPSCVQMHGYDQIQYINTRYPFPVVFPRVARDNPCWHYRRKFTLDKKDGEKYYLNFERTSHHLTPQYIPFSPIRHLLFVLTFYKILREKCQFRPKQLTMQQTPTNPYMSGQ